MTTKSEGLQQNQQQAVQFLTPKSLLSSEKIRGAITSVVSGGVSGSMNLMGVTLLGLSGPMSAFLMLYVFGSMFGYSVDILFAKQNFTIKKKGQAPFTSAVPYTDFKTRALWLVASLIDRHFFRFVITVIIDTLIGITMLQALIRYFDDENILTDFAYRDMLLAGAVAIITFFLYTNVLRFDWAYSDADSPLMNVLVLMWVGMVLMVYAVFYSIISNQSDSRKKSSAANMFYSDALGTMRMEENVNDDDQSP